MNTPRLWHNYSSAPSLKFENNTGTLVQRVSTCGKGIANEDIAKNATVVVFYSFNNSVREDVKRLYLDSRTRTGPLFYENEIQLQETNQKVSLFQQFYKLRTTLLEIKAAWGGHYEDLIVAVEPPPLWCEKSTWKIWRAAIETLAQTGCHVFWCI